MVYFYYYFWGRWLLCPLIQNRYNTPSSTATGAKAGLSFPLTGRRTVSMGTFTVLEIAQLVENPVRLAHFPRDLGRGARKFAITNHTISQAHEWVICFEFP